MRPHFHLAAVLLLFFSGLGLASAAERQGEPFRPGEAQIAFKTLDGDVQQVNVDEIWRIRAATAHDEPAGAVVIDYGFERLSAKEDLESVAGKVTSLRPLKKFTAPGGAPVYIIAAKIIGITRPIPHQHHEKTKAVIVAREGQQQVQESREAITETLK